MSMYVTENEVKLKKSLHIPSLPSMGLLQAVVGYFPRLPVFKTAYAVAAAPDTISPILFCFVLLEPKIERGRKEISQKYHVSFD